MLRSLIAGGRFDNKLKKIIPVSPPLNFADILYPVIQDHIIEWATGSSSFVVLSLLETENFSSKAEVLEKLKKGKKDLQKAATEETPEQKAKAAEIAGAGKENGDVKAKKGKKKAAPTQKAVGNAGSRMLLSMLWTIIEKCMELLRIPEDHDLFHSYDLTWATPSLLTEFRSLKLI